MPVMTCDCGRRTEVTLAEAGSLKTCSRCLKTVSVPSLTQLKRQAGDVDPLASDWDKLVSAIERNAPPFDGRCQKCGYDRADVILRIELSVLVQRDVAVEQGVDCEGRRRTADVEQWRTVIVPHSLCERCYQQFQWMYLVRSTIAHAAAVTTLGLTLAANILLHNWTDALATALDRRKHKSNVASTWFQPVPVLGEVLDGEDEFRLQKL